MGRAIDHGLAPVMGARFASVTVGLSLALGVAFPAAAVAEEATPIESPVNVAQVALVMPLTLPISTGTFIDAATLAAATAPGGILFSELDAVIDRGVTIGIDPMVIASIRVLGVSAPPSALEWLDRLAGATNETFELSWADSDITAVLQADPDRGVVMTPGTLDFAIDPTLFATPSTSTPVPDASAEAPTPMLPTSSSLVDWNYSLANVSWPQADSVIESDLTTIDESGYVTTILASKNVTRTSKVAATATIKKRQVVVADETISALLDGTLDETSDDAWQSAIDATTAAITAFSKRSNEATLVLTLGRGTPVVTARLAQSVSAIAELDAADVVPLGTVIDGPTAKATLIDQPQSEARLAGVRQLVRAEKGDRRFSTIAETPKLITGERRLRLLTTVSPGAAEHEGGWQGAVNEYLSESSALRDSVRIVQSGEILLAADRQSIPIAIDNDLGQPVTVFIRVEPSLPYISVEDGSVEVTVAASSQGKAVVPVESLRNGEVELSIDMSTITRVSVDSTRVSMSVRAGWEGPVTLVLGILVVALFIFGIIRTVIRRRRASASDAGSE